MLQAFDTGIDRLADCRRRVGVHRYICAPIAGRLNGCTDLGFGVLDGLKRIVLRTDAPATHQLYLTCALSELLPRPEANLVRTVGDCSNTFKFGMAERTAKGARQLEGEAEVTVSGGLGDEGPRGVDAGANHDAFIDGALKAEHRAAHIADGGETAHKRRFCLT